MTRDEIIAAAEKEGLKIRTAFMDDWKENVAISIFFFIAGWTGHWLWNLF